MRDSLFILVFGVLFLCGCSKDHADDLLCNEMFLWECEFIAYPDNTADFQGSTFDRIKHECVDWSDWMAVTALYKRLLDTVYTGPEIIPLANGNRRIIIRNVVQENEPIECPICTFMSSEMWFDHSGNIQEARDRSGEVDCDGTITPGEHVIEKGIDVNGLWRIRVRRIFCN